MSSRWPWKTRGGYTDMGSQQLPVLPPYIILTDRVTGGKWLLAYNGSAVSVSASLPNAGQPSVTYAAGEEPYIYNSAGARAQLVVSSGVLGVASASSTPTPIPGNGIVAARNGLNSTFAQVILSLTLPYTYTFTAVTA